MSLFFSFLTDSYARFAAQNLAQWHTGPKDLYIPGYREDIC